jgi:hypothetical protein
MKKFHKQLGLIEVTEETKHLFEHDTIKEEQPKQSSVNIIRVSKPKRSKKLAV